MEKVTNDELYKIVREQKMEYDTTIHNGIESIVLLEGPNTLIRLFHILGTKNMNVDDIILSYPENHFHFWIISIKSKE